MSLVENNGVQTYYEEHGSGPETVVLAHGLLWSSRMFEQQVRALEADYRCITFDFRGQGKSEATLNGYGMDEVTEDTAKLIEQLNCTPCHFVGLSMGGFVGMRLAIRRPELLRSLVLLNTTADPEPQENLGHNRRLAFVARWFGFRFVANPVSNIMFGTRFLNDPSRDDLKRRWRDGLISSDKKGTLRAVQGVLVRDGVYEQLDQIVAPTLVVVGEQDVATRPEVGRRIHERISHSEFVSIPNSGHSSTVEEPEAVNEALIEFLAQRRG